MSLILTSLLVASGVFVGRWIMRSGGSGAPEESVAKDDEEVKKSDDEKPAPEADALAEFPCRLGDVVLRMGGGEAWLSGALVFSEDMPIAALFIAPDAGADRALLVRPRPSTMLLWLDPLPAGAIGTGSEPPSCVEHEGQRYDRTRRLPVRVARVGTGAPDVGDRAILGEYTRGDGERLVVVVGAGPARAWRGIALEQGMYEILPAGPSGEIV